jgi:transposase
MGFAIDRDINAAINIKRRGIERLKESMYAGMGTPEVTPVETGSIPERANPAVETGSPRL